MESKENLKQSKLYALLSAPYILWMIIFIVVPLCMVAYFAFTTSGGAFTLARIP